MPYSFDGKPTAQVRRCSDCDTDHESVKGFVLKDDAAYAIYFADSYPHQGEA